MHVENDNAAGARGGFTLTPNTFGVTSRSEGGFSLIELLVVIAIIGILSSIVMASLSSARLRSRDSRRLADMKQVQIGLELYYDEKGYYPGCPAASDYAGCFNDAMATLKASGYLPSIPSDPLSTTPDTYAYVYAPLTGGSTSKCKSYHLGATLEDAGNSSLKDAAHATAPTGGGNSCPVPDPAGGGGNAGTGTDFKATGVLTCGKGHGTDGATDATGNRCYDLKP